MSANQYRQWIAIIISIVFHILLAIIPIQMSKEIISHEKKEFKVPVNIVIKEIDPVASLPRQEKTVKQKTKHRTLPKKRGLLPGDRKLPVISQSIPIPYPKSAINNEWEGKVTIAVKLNSMGKITKITLIKSSGYKVLDDMLINVVSEHYRFKPKRIMGKNKAGLLQISHTFKL